MFNKQNVNNIKISGKICYCTSIIIFLLSFVYGNQNTEISDFLFILFWCVLFIGSFFFFMARKAISEALALQCLSISILIWGFWFSTLRESIVYKADYNKIVALSGCLALTFMVIIWSIISATKKTPYVHLFLNYIKHNYYVFIIILVYLFFYLECFTFLFKADSNAYYTTLVANEGLWTFSLSDIQKFQLGYHSTYGYSLFVFLGNYILRIYGIGIRIANFLLLAITLFCLNDILRNIIPKQKNIFYALLLEVFACNPLILGIAQEINTDTPMTLFLIWFIWAFLHHYKIYTIFFACIACFSKENAVILLFGYVAGVYLYRLITEHKNLCFKKIFTILKPNEWAIIIAPIFFLANMLLYNSWNYGGTDAVTIAGKNMVNSFQFNLEYICIKLSQMFIFNFQWLYLIMFTAGIVLLVILHKKSTLNEIEMGIFISFICYSAFQLFYFTYPHYRYLIPNAFYFMIFTGIIAKNINKKALCNSVLLIFTLLFIVQSFYSVDIISNHVFRNVSTGNGKIISQAYYGGDAEFPNHLLLEADGGDLTNEIFRDYVQNNRQYTRFEKCLEKVFTKINYTNDKAILLSPIYKDSYWGNDCWTFYNLLGTLDRNSIHWNQRLKQFTYEENDLVIHWLNSEDYFHAFDEYEEIWYIEFPYDTPFDFKQYKKQFEIKNEITITYGEWKINAYRICPPPSKNK
jgi:hypothetical protein